MTRAFTLVELMICLAILAIICAIAIPNLVEAQKHTEAAKTVVGKTFEINGMKTMILEYVGNDKYKVLLLGPTPIQVEMTAGTVKEAYDLYNRTHAEKP